jgi:putative endonuclease
MAAVPWFVYVARCSDGSLYCGVARDVAARIAQHDAGKGARYTRGRGPLTTLAVRKCKSHGDALRLEIAVKRLKREDKEALANKRRFRALQLSVLRTVGRPSDGPQLSVLRTVGRPSDGPQLSVGAAQQRKPVE